MSLRDRLLDEAAAPKADVGWANSQAKAAKKAAQSRWGAGWNLLSVEQQKGAVALEVIRTIAAQAKTALGPSEEAHTLAALAKAGMREGG